ncbi:hypothetical protein ONZ45_g4262 [Pleurotus djamor]|nr:hypothetical protein ONZ45_g4262 [Pleurotus djamor]
MLAGDTTHESAIVMSTPVPGILYRIQNVDFQTYIEMPNLTASTVVELRPLKDVKRQQWYLEPDGDSKFYIRSATDSNLYLGQLYSGLVYYNTKNNCDKLSDTCATTASNPFHFIHSFNNGTNLYVTSSTDNRKVGYSASSPLDPQKWNFIPVTSGTPTGTSILADGDYRIRTLGGPFTLTLSRAPADGTHMRPQVYVKPQDPPKDDQIQTDHQRWHVTRKANGRYTLQNAGGSLYMSSGTPNSSQGDLLTAKATEFEWDLQSIGNSLWSIKLPISLGKEAGLSAGFADGQANNGDVLAKSQIWIFDKYVPLGADKTQANREVPAGKYVIRNCRTVDTYVTAKNNRGWEIISESTNFAPIYKFELEYVGDTAKFILKYVREPNVMKIPVKVNAGMLIGDETPSEFVLIKTDGTAPGYFICPADSTQKVVSMRLKDDPFNGKKGLAIDPRIDGDTSLMWTFQ